LATLAQIADVFSLALKLNGTFKIIKQRGATDEPHGWFLLLLFFLKNILHFIDLKVPSKNAYTF
jgi:hypothetical protein